MNILVTGGNGFLGSNLVRTLVQRNYNVLVISRKCNSLVDILNKIQFIQQKGGYKEHRDKILAFRPDYILHFAWEGGNNYKDTNNIQQFYNNIPYGIELLTITNECEKKPVFVGVGSFAEYGILTQKAVEEQVDSPTTLYGMAKSLFKTISNKFCIEHDIPWVWVRPCYVYGTNDVATRLIPSTINKLLAKEDVTLDNCNVIIDYLHISDFASAILRILETHSLGIFNICSGEEYNLKDILKTIEFETNANGILSFDNRLLRHNLSKYIVGDNSKLKRIGWVPNVHINDGLVDLIREAKMARFLKTNPVDGDGLHCEN